MKYTLRLENANEISSEELRLFALTPSIANPATARSYTYVVKPIRSSEEQKGEVEQNENFGSSSLTKIILTYSSYGFKTMNFYFRTSQECKKFIGKFHDRVINFTSVLGQDESVHLDFRFANVSICEQFKSRLMQYFNLQEECIDNILCQVFLVSYQENQNRRQDILASFKSSLKECLSRCSENERSRESMSVLVQKLIEAAKEFDRTQQRAENENSVLLLLGNICLSFQLYKSALKVFEQISYLSEEKPLAQAQIAEVYMTYMTKKNEGSLDSDVQSYLDENPSTNYDYLQKVYIVAYYSKQFEQCATIANLLCNYNENKFKNSDFTGAHYLRSMPGTLDLSAYATPFFQACQIIREQQEKITQLEKKPTEQASSRTTTSTASASMLNAGPHFRRPHT